jgi:TonB family protein
MPSDLQALPAPPTFEQDSSSPTPDVAYDATKIVPFAQENLEGTIDKMSAGMAAQLPLPPLQLPAPRRLETGNEVIPPLPSHATEVAAAIIEQSLQAPGVPSGEEKPIGWGEVRIGDKQIPNRPGLPTIDQRLIARHVPAMPSPRPPLSPLPHFGIQGPAARREPLYRPALPEVQVYAESDITLKFWVRPDGVVSRILPERKGDAALEVAAIRYLEGWRFTPLPPHEPQVEQWGTITIRFLLRER